MQRFSLGDRVRVREDAECHASWKGQTGKLVAAMDLLGMEWEVAVDGDDILPGPSFFEDELEPE